MKRLKKELEKQKIGQLLNRENRQTPYIRIGVLIGSIFVTWLLKGPELERSHFLLVWFLYGVYTFFSWALAHYRWITKSSVTKWWIFSFSVDTSFGGFLVYSTGGVFSPVAPLLAGSLMRALVAYPNLPSFYVMFLVHLVVYCAAVLSLGGSGVLFRPEFWFNFLLLFGTGMITAYVIRNNDEISLARMQLAGESAELKMLAVTDGLTKIYNYRYFQQCLIEEMRRAARFDIPVSLLIFDIDLFKTYNDTFGHPAGDRVLKEVAQILRRHLRSSDILCRYGGDEFVAILVGANGDDAAQVARKTKEAVENFPFQGREYLPGGKLSISVGVATYPDDALNHVDLVAEADRRLYAAKTSGGRENNV
ncbi:MAG TPA: GGDEF domain-containing protein [Syntrophomonadaceae bacterium]|nr:GGDEF domain-containing protein [Syntrophomonadaceae bacterium]